MARAVRVVDESNNNANVDFSAIRKAGAKGAWLKVAEGLNFVDGTYAARNAAARKAGLRVGGYYFGHPASDPRASAEKFLSLLVLRPGDLLPVLDIETTDGKTPAEVKSWVAAFIAAVRAKIGEHPVIYTGAYFEQANLLSALPGPRWLASYGATPKARWDAWQFTDGQAQYPGSIAGLDTSTVPNLALVTYKAPRPRRAAGRVKAAASRKRRALKVLYRRSSPFRAM